MYKIVPDPKNLKGFAVFQHERIKEERKSPSLSERGIAVEKHWAWPLSSCSKVCPGVSKDREVDGI